MGRKVRMTEANESVKSQKRCWDITVPHATAVDWSPEALVDCIKEDVVDYKFQKEHSKVQQANGTWHYQFRGVWSDKIRGLTIPRKYPCFKGAHVSLTSGEVAGRGKMDWVNWDYVQKGFSRVQGDGPNGWDSRGKGGKRGLLTRKVRKVLALGLFPWQQFIVDSFTAQMFDETADDRVINVMISLAGNDGRGTLGEYCMYMDLAADIMPQDNVIQIMGQVIDQRHTGYVIDFPRCCFQGDRKALARFYTAMERLKDGKGCDPRNKNRPFQMESPCIWIFTNSKPDVSMLSITKWAFWTCEVFGGPMVRWRDGVHDIKRSHDINTSPSGKPPECAWADAKCPEAFPLGDVSKYDSQLKELKDLSGLEELMNL